MADLVSPVWAPLIGLLLVVAVVVSGWRLAGRGPSRMRRALLTVGGGLVALWLLGMLFQACSGPVTGTDDSLQGLSFREAGTTAPEPGSRRLAGRRSRGHNGGAPGSS